MENKEIYGYIYLITNLVNGKQYVGKTVQTIKARFGGHCNPGEMNKKCLISKAIKKYGKENFKIKEIAVAYNQKQLKFSEGFYISSFNTLTPNGYNLTNIINGYSKHSEETKEKMRIARNKPKNLKISSSVGIKTRGKSLGGTSKYCGVHVNNNKYICQIMFNNKPIYIGSYNLESDSAKAYDIAAIRYFGNGTILNFPELREDYINGKITVNKNTRQNYSKSGIEGILFKTKNNKWQTKYFDKTLNKNRHKFFNTLEEAIKFKNTNY